MIDTETRSILLDKMYELVKAMALATERSTNEVTNVYNDASAFSIDLFYKLNWEEQLELCKEYAIFQALVYKHLDNTQKTALSLMDG